jgi:hypothetical protein
VQLHLKQNIAAFQFPVTPGTPLRNDVFVNHQGFWRWNANAEIGDVDSDWPDK